MYSFFESETESEAEFEFNSKSAFVSEECLINSSGEKSSDGNDKKKIFEKKLGFRDEFFSKISKNVLKIEKTLVFENVIFFRKEKS